MSELVRGRGWDTSGRAADFAQRDGMSAAQRTRLLSITYHGLISLVRRDAMPIMLPICLINVQGKHGKWGLSPDKSQTK